MKSLEEKTSIFKPVFLITMIPVLTIMIVLLVHGINQHSASDIMLSLFFLFCNVLILVLLIRCRLELTMDKTGISFRFWMLKKRTEHFSWEHLKQVELIHFDMISEFGGWGKRKSKRFGTGYLTRGSNGLLLRSSNGELITLSVQQTALAAEIISQYIPG